jgi:hypothetical protein
MTDKRQRRFITMSVEEARMWVNLMGRREAERYYPGILAIIKAAKPGDDPAHD